MTYDASKTSTDPVDLLQPIVDAEIALQIKKRREEELLSTDKLESNLVGLAFSGGGIRAGAVSLGVMQGLQLSDRLRYVDYLSTVSGGGYAGAYLSSLATAQNSAAQQSTTKVPNLASAQNGGDKNVAAKRPASQIYDLPITPEKSGRQPPRILRFLDTARRFSRPLIFSNRYLIGLLLNWIVVFSGLIAVASFVAWLFRKVYDPDALDRLFVLGFQDDLGVCMFPPLLVFVLWLCAWGVSYWRRGSRATGLIARALFFLLLVTTGVSFAAILGAGDIDASKWHPQGTPSNNEQVNRLFGTVQSLVLTAILASLLPYLNPMRLFRSGAPTASTVEKYSYAIASRALVVGVPFLVMSYFVRENISDWYAHRNGTVYRSEITDWAAFDPANAVAYGPATLWYDALAASNVKSHYSEMRQAETTSDMHNHYFHESANRVVRPSTVNASTYDTKWKMSMWTRWGYLLEDLSLDRLPGGRKNQSRFDAFYTARQQVRSAQDAIAAELTLAISHEDFAERFLPELGVTNNPPGKPLIEDQVKFKKFPTPADRVAWIEELKSAWHEAKSTGDLELPPLQDLEGAAMAKATQQNAVLNANRNLLQAYYGAALHPTTTIFSGVVWPLDQQARKSWFLVSLAAFALFALVVDLNATSCHGYYAEHTAECWIEEVPGFGRNVPLVQLANVDTGRPYHLISGSVRLSGRRLDHDHANQREDFLFSKLFCGSDNLAYKPTADFMRGEYALADAIAASGAAISPVDTTNPLTGLLLTLMNFRLGQWVENPAYKSNWWSIRHAQRWPFTPARWLWSLLQPADKRPFCIVTDGGHYDNLGIEALLRRHCKLILSIDAGQDEHHQFEDFARLARRARVEYGIQFTPLDGELARDLLADIELHDEGRAPTSPEKSSEAAKKGAKAGSGKASTERRPPPPRWSKRHHIVARIVYRDGSTGLLIYMKSTMTGNEPLDLIKYQRQNPQFPHHPTSDNLLTDADQFLSYVQLGCHIATEVGQTLPDGLDTISVDELAQRFSTPKTEDVRGEAEHESADGVPPPHNVGQRDHRTGTHAGTDPFDHWLDGVISDAISSADGTGGEAEQIMQYVSMALAPRREDAGKRILPRIREALQATEGHELKTRARQVRRSLVRYLEQSDP